mgnify:CR=1 FL=1|jgi:hypothetical protein
MGNKKRRANADGGAAGLEVPLVAELSVGSDPSERMDVSM